MAPALLTLHPAQIPHLQLLQRQVSLTVNVKGTCARRSGFQAVEQQPAGLFNSEFRVDSAAPWEEALALSYP